MIYTRFVSEPGMGASSPEFCVITLTTRPSFFFFLAIALRVKGLYIKLYHCLQSNLINDGNPVCAEY